MAKRYDSISPEVASFIEKQPIFFVATALVNGRVNLSPKGMDSLRVLDENKVIWLNLTGSGNETATHLLSLDRMTIMTCAFEGKPMILRLYGNATVYHPRDHEWNEYIDLFPKYTGSRQLILMDVDLVQTSCGMSVPLMDFRGDRNELTHWADKKGTQKIQNYWKEKNTESLDGHPTGILE
jgi:hypothetical protein